MKTFPVTAIVVLFAALGCGGAAPAPGQTIMLDPGTATIKVEITNVRSSKGAVKCALFNAQDGFPGPSPIIGGQLDQSAATGSMHCEFDMLPAGTYAVSAFHDENGNGKIDKTLVGSPAEGFGQTNNVFHSTGPSTFEESKVTVADGETLSKQINFKY